MESLAWIDAHLKPVERSEASFLYEGMDSQSGRSLPLIYEPFDPNLQAHWADRARRSTSWPPREAGGSWTSVRATGGHP